MPFQTKPSKRAAGVKDVNQQSPVDSLPLSRPTLASLQTTLHDELDKLFSSLCDICRAVDSVTYTRPEEEQGAAGREALPAGLEQEAVAIDRVRAMRESMDDLYGRLAL